jgi:hypothetical protein
VPWGGNLATLDLCDAHIESVRGGRGVEADRAVGRVQAQCAWREWGQNSVRGGRGVEADRAVGRVQAQCAWSEWGQNSVRGNSARHRS